MVADNLIAILHEKASSEAILALTPAPTSTGRTHSQQQPQRRRLNNQHLAAITGDGTDSDGQFSTAGSSLSAKITIHLLFVGLPISIWKNHFLQTIVL